MDLRFVSVSALASLLLISAQPTRAALTDEVRRDTEWLAGYPSRVVGSEGHAAAQQQLREAMGKIPGVRTHIQEFSVTVPIVEKATLMVEGDTLGGVHRLYPVWPDLVRLKNTPEGGIAGRPVYVGAARTEDLPARSLHGQIAVMEMSDYRRWRAPFTAGAAALLLLGGPGDEADEPAQQALYKPRYYIPEGPLADALRTGAIERVRIDCDASWQTVTARNLLAVVAPPENASPALEPIVVFAPYDSMSIVQGLAPGADNALDAALLLNWLRQAAANPPPRPVLFAFVDAYSISQRGARELFLMLSASPTDSTREDYEKLNQDLLEEYREVAAQAEELGEGVAALEPLYDKRNYRQIQRYVKDVVGPEILKLREDNGDLRLEIEDTGDPVTKAALEQRLEAQKERLTFLNTLLTQILTRDPLEARFHEAALTYWTAVRQRIRSQLDTLEQEVGVYAKLDELRAEVNQSLGLGSGSERGVNFALGIDLSDSATKVGPRLYNPESDLVESTAARDFLRWLKPMVRADGALYDESLQHVLSIDAVMGNWSAKSFNPNRLALPTAAASSFLMDAVSWCTVDGVPGRLDTPQDRAERLDWERIAPQIDFTTRIFNRLVTDESFKAGAREGDPELSRWRHINGTIVAESLAETVPRTPEPGMLVTYIMGRANWPGMPASPGVRRNEFVTTGPDGRFQFPATAGNRRWYIRQGIVQAYGLADDGRIVKGLSDSASMLAGRVSASFDLNGSPSATPVRSVTFECVERDGPLFFDPRFLEPLNAFRVLDVQRGGTPKRYHFSVHHGQMFGLFMPETRWQLILRAGVAAKRMALMNIPEDLLDSDMSLRDAMRVGFGAQEPLPSIPAHISARDFHNVDLWRRDKYAEAGIVSDSINGLLDETARLLAEADEALQADDGAALQRSAASALANEIRAYEALKTTADDVTRGAVFLMLLLVPFAIVVERLVFACTRIYARISAALGVFVVMTAILWSFHPAFRITSQPLIILMAFSILLLSLAVISMIMRKFEGDLEEMRSGRAEASGAETRRGGVIGSAVWLGIANMRKRKLRTTLTALTIVLITFALLCFSSSTTYQTHRELPLRDVQSPYSGVLIRLPGMQAMTLRAADAVANLLPEGTALSPRYWWTDRDTTWRLRAVNPADGSELVLKAALGLGANESLMTRPQRFLPNWEQFARDGGCYLSKATADALGLKPGDPVLLAGTALTLVGTFDASEVDREWRMLDGRPILPYDFTVSNDLFANQDALEAQLSSGEGLVEETETTCVAGDELIIVPGSFLEQTGSLRSIAVHTQDDHAAESLTEALMKVLAFPMYCSTPTGVKAIVATPLIARPPRNLVVPLIIAALIILNTMLNSVAERKGEIHIYTSLGLAPRHVGVLFVAEALTYGLLGTISGYVLGQGLATILTSFHLMGGVTLNYSGTNVIMTMGLVLLVVVISAIVPAIMAGRLATPSKEMNWNVPQPKNGLIRDLLPFTVTLAAAKGLVAFIYEYMDAHREGSIGTFTADALELLPRDENRITGLKGTVWLAPYDLGVRQEFGIEVTPETEDICTIHITLEHGAGEPRTWWRLNKSFLRDVRRQLLGWRRVPAERVMQYITNAELGMRNAE